MYVLSYGVQYVIITVLMQATVLISCRNVVDRHSFVGGCWCEVGDGGSHLLLTAQARSVVITVVLDGF